jgi:tripartite-type tricarboxylate transporter receptor subunit TctC
VTALLAGDVQVLSLNPTALIAHVQARQAACAGAIRRATFAAGAGRADGGRAGYRDYEAPVWMAVMAPAAAPREAIARLNAELTASFAIPP